MQDRLSKNENVFACKLNALKHLGLKQQNIIIYRHYIL